MTTKSKEIIRRAMGNAKGDDLERAERAFRGMNSKYLKEQHGESGQTRQQILDGYRQDRSDWNMANTELERLINAL